MSTKENTLLPKASRMKTHNKSLLINNHGVAAGASIHPSIRTRGSAAKGTRQSPLWSLPSSWFQNLGPNSKSRCLYVSINRTQHKKQHRTCATKNLWRDRCKLADLIISRFTYVFDPPEHHKLDVFPTSSNPNPPPMVGI